VFVNRISITREGFYGYGKSDPSKPLRTTIEVEGQHGKIELNLSPELSDRVVKIVAEEIAAAGRETAAALTAQCLSAKPSKQIAA
jgi:hypothetical protein